MIEYRIDRRSGIAPYMQIVQQTRQALRMGRLGVGDKLPTAREVVAATAINPNTVLKAYRELEHEGLIDSRAEVGAFVAPDPRPARIEPGVAAGSRPAQLGAACPGR